MRHVGVDLPGHGRSPDRALDRASLAGVLADIAAHDDLRHIVALSFGTIVALELAARALDRFESVTLGAATFAGAPLDADAQTLHLELQRLAHAGEPPSVLAARWLRSPPEIFTGARRQPALFSELAAVVRAHRWTELASGGNQLTAGDQRRLLRRIRAPTLVIVGDNDMATFRRSAKLVTDLVADARRVHLPEVGHLCLLEAPDVCAKLVRQHVTGGDINAPSARRRP